MIRGEAHDLLVKQLVLALAQTRLCRVWEQPTGAAFRKGHLIHYGLVGCADISGILRGGKRIEIEVKTGKAVQTVEQKAFQKIIGDFGGIYYVARDLLSTIEFVKSAAAE